MRGMVEQFLKFGDFKIENKDFHSSKKVIDQDEWLSKKKKVSIQFAYGKHKETDAKYVIGHKTGENIGHCSSCFHKLLNTTTIKLKNLVNVL